MLFLSVGAFAHYNVGSGPQETDSSFQGINGMMSGNGMMNSAGYGMMDSGMMGQGYQGMQYGVMR